MSILGAPDAICYNAMQTDTTSRRFFGRLAFLFMLWKKWVRAALKETLPESYFIFVWRVQYAENPFNRAWC